MFKGLLHGLLVWCGLKPPGVYAEYRPETERQRRRREYDNWLKQQQALAEFERGPKPTPPAKDN